jgi:hypothetical protein
MKTARLQFFAMVDDISLKKGTMKVYKLKKKVQRNHCKYESWITWLILITILPWPIRFYNYEWLYTAKLLGNNAIEIFVNESGKDVLKPKIN